MVAAEDSQKSREVIEEKTRDVKEFEAPKLRRINSH